MRTSVEAVNWGEQLFFIVGIWCAAIVFDSLPFVFYGASRTSPPTMNGEIWCAAILFVPFVFKRADIESAPTVRNKIKSVGAIHESPVTLSALFFGGRPLVDRIKQTVKTNKKAISYLVGDSLLLF